MIEILVAVALAPLLLAQGRRARRIALQLPEAAGPRSGRCGRGAACLRVLVVGDSAAAGVGVATQDEALSGQLVRSLHAARADTAIQWRLLARSGIGVRAALAMVGAARPEPFDVVVVALGVNDVTGGVGVAAWLRAMERLVDELRAHWGGPRIWVSGLPPMHRFPLLPQPLRWVLGERARRFDAALGAWAQTQEGVAHVALPVAGSPEMIAADGFHPGAPACALWGAELARRIVDAGSASGMSAGTTCWTAPREDPSGPPSGAGRR